MTSRFFTLENTLYLGLFGLALALRLNQLGLAPLTDAEARAALAALHPNRPDLVPLGPLYHSLTMVTFWLFGPDNVSARLWPALAGALLALTPALFRDVLGRGTALLTGLFIALSAGLVAASRSADGLTLVMLTGLAGVGVLRLSVQHGLDKARLTVAGVLLGLALTGGGAFFTGALIVGLPVLAVREGRAGLKSIWQAVWPQRFPLTLTVLATAALSLTVFTFYPAGPGAWANSLAHWLGGWSVLEAEGRHLFIAPAWAFIYEWPVFLLGGLGAARAWWRGHTVMRLVSVWVGVAVLFTVVYSGRSVFDAQWLTLMLCVLAGWFTAEMLTVQDPYQPVHVATLAAVLVSLLGFAWLNFLSFAEQVRTNPALDAALLNLNGANVQLSPLVFLGLGLLALAACALVTVLFGYGWSPTSARLGAILTVLGVGLLTGLSTTWNLTQRPDENPHELWWPIPAHVGLHRLADTVRDTSDYVVGQENEIVIVAQAPADGALAWALRDFRKTQFVNLVDAQVNAPVVITPLQVNNPTLGSAYVGQGFSVAVRWFPEANMTWPQQLAWLIIRRVPDTAQQNDQVILWVRQDAALFPNAQTP